MVKSRSGVDLGVGNVSLSMLFCGAGTRGWAGGDQEVNVLWKNCG